MADEAILLRVTGVSGCGVLRPGDRWVVSQTEVIGLEGSRLCPHALYQLYPELSDRIRAAGGQDGTFRCARPECHAVFAVEQWERPARPFDGTCVTRRMESAAVAMGENLRRAGTFMSRLSSALALEVVAVAGRRQGEPGIEFLSTGTRGERLFIVAEGQVEVIRPSAQGRAETVLAVLGPGECFGEMSLLTDQPTSAAVRARTACTLFTLTRPQLEELLRRSPELSRVFSQLLAERLRALNRTLENELERGMRGRLSTLPFGDLVQLLHAGRRTGTLFLSGPGCEARLSFQDGRLTGAESGGAAGDEAFFELARWPEGEFRLEPELGPFPETARVHADTLALLMEALRRMDEAQAASG